MLVLLLLLPWLLPLPVPLPAPLLYHCLLHSSRSWHFKFNLAGNLQLLPSLYLFRICIFFRLPLSCCCCSLVESNPQKRCQSILVARNCCRLSATTPAVSVIPCAYTNLAMCDPCPTCSYYSWSPFLFERLYYHA
jgi:hypothetical protein